MPHVLIVEDNLALLESIAYDLKMLGYQVTKATDGRSALGHLQTGTTCPDVIVSDIDMPDMDGFALLEAIQKQPEWVEVPFIFLTGFDTPEDIRLGKRLGADDYLVKPFNIEDLTVAIENKLRRLIQIRDNIQQQHIDQVRQELLAIIRSREDNLLNMLDAYSGGELLLEDLEALPDEFSQRALEAIRQTSHQTNRLINQIALLTRLDRGEMSRFVRSQAHPSNLQLMVESACGILAQEFHDPPPVFQVDRPDRDIYVRGVWDLLTLIISEVMRNGLVFSQPGTPVHIRLIATDVEGIVQVIDQGIGIAEEHNPFIWERFTQFCITGRPQQGSGLGLAVVSELMRVLGGRVWLESQPGLGTQVSLSFPLI